MTVQIPLTKECVAIVDDEDIDLAALKWYTAHFYACRKTSRVNGVQKIERMHRVILERKLGRELDTKEVCDHIDNNRLNNRRSNLRVATQAQNTFNTKHASQSGYKGVTWNKHCKKWQVQVRANRKSHYIGIFDSPLVAHQAYVEAAKTLHGEFANFQIKESTPL